MAGQVNANGRVVASAILQPASLSIAALSAVTAQLALVRQHDHRHGVGQRHDPQR